MSFLTDEEKLELLMSAITTLGELYQDLAHAPALTLWVNNEVSDCAEIPAHNSELKKIRRTCYIFPA